jgi:hypothetical protein
VAINNLPSSRSTATASEAGSLGIAAGPASGSNKIKVLIANSVLNGNCAKLRELEYSLDFPPKGDSSLLDALRPETEQSSPPEEVFDHVVVTLGCGDPT